MTASTSATWSRMTAETSRIPPFCRAMHSPALTHTRGLAGPAPDPALWGTGRPVGAAGTSDHGRIDRRVPDPVAELTVTHLAARRRSEHGLGAKGSIPCRRLPPRRLLTRGEPAAPGGQTVSFKPSPRRLLGGAVAWLMAGAVAADNCGPTPRNAERTCPWYKSRRSGGTLRGRSRIGNSPSMSICRGTPLCPPPLGRRASASAGLQPVPDLME
jgi:hypothetical protein